MLIVIIMNDVNSRLIVPTDLKITKQQDGHFCVCLFGEWTLHKLTKNPSLLKQIKQLAHKDRIFWDLTSIKLIDNGTALLLWQAWGQIFPPELSIKPEHQRFFNNWQTQMTPDLTPSGFSINVWIDYIWQIIWTVFIHLQSLITISGQLVLDCFYLLKHPNEIPWSEISITIFDAGVRALGITALVGFLIGIVLSYLSALQLKMFGAEIYIIDILGMSIIRELGPLLAAILVAGRSGSAMTAQIGIMRVTEELDALSALGISHSLRLVFPKVIALIFVLPLLAMWTNTAALAGGMFSAQNTLDIGYQQFFEKLPDSVPLVNVYIGLTKSAVFGLMIALVASHFGFRSKPNTESLGNETTNSVVAAITVVIMTDAVFAILFMDIGMP